MSTLQAYKEQFISFLYGALMFMQIDVEIAKALITLIFLDMLLGSLKSAVIPTMTFKFSQFWFGLTKKALLLIIVFVLALTAKALGYEDFTLMVDVVFKIMILNEAISNINCIRSIYHKKEYKSSDIMSYLLEKIEHFLSSKLKKLIEILEDKDKTNE